LPLSDGQREVLQTLVKSRIAAHRDVQRAQALLLAADGAANTQTRGGFPRRLCATATAVRRSPRGRHGRFCFCEKEPHRGLGVSARAGGWRDRELSAYGSRGPGRDLSMTGHWGAEILTGIGPDCVTGALAGRRAPVVGEVALEARRFKPRD